MEIFVEIPLQAGFFFQKGNGEELWVHFKYEKLADVCFICGMLSYVTSRCTFKEPAKITSKEGISASLYGHWLKASSKQFLCFVAPAPVEDDRKLQKQATNTSQASVNDNLGNNNNFEFSVAQQLHKDNPNQIILPIVDSNQVIRDSGETYEELQAIMCAEVEHSNTHGLQLEHKLWKDDRLELLLNMVQSSPCCQR